MNRNVLLAIVAIATVAALVGQLSAQTVYDPATGFSNQNPSGPWRYVGWNPTASGFTDIGYYDLDFSYTEDWIGIGVPAWYFNANECPAVASNTTGADVSYLTSFTLQDGLVMMHPDTYTAQLLYFTAPQAGYYDISAVMTATDTGNTAADMSDGKDGPAVGIYRWSFGCDPQYGGGFTANNQVGQAFLPVFGDSFSYSVSNEYMNAGDVVAFMVYPDGDGNGDWTDFAFDAVECDIDITRVTDATLDPAWGLENGHFEAPALQEPAVIVPQGWLKMPEANDLFGMYTAHANLPGGVPAEGNQTFFLDSRNHVSGYGGDVFQCVGELNEMSDVTLSLLVGGAPEGTCPLGDYEVGLWTDSDGDGLPDTALATAAGTPTADTYEMVIVTAGAVAAAIPVFVRLTVAGVPGAYRQTFFDDLVLAVGNVLPGDADRNGVVNEADAAILAANWQGAGKSWGQGDFNGDGTVDDKDATLLATNWQTETASGATVPEPSAAILLASIVLSIVFVRRR